MHGLLLNLRLALRQLRRTPGFALTVVLTLALGIGATTAIFSLVEGVLLRPLPFHDPASLISISDSLNAESLVDDAGVTAAEIRSYLHDTTSFGSLGGYTGTSYELSGRGEPAMVNATRMTAGVFPTLAVAPSMGRVFTQQEDDGHATVAVLSYHVWQSRFHGDPNILGNKILLDRKPYVVIGVMPRNFEFPLVAGRLNQSELWVPMSFTPDELSPTSAANWGYNMVGRLKPGLSLEQANQDADRVAREVMRNFPPEFKQIHITAHVNSLKESTVKAGKPLVHILMYAVLVVLLIACLNVAGLLLVRAIRRRRELAVRLALGASPRALLGNSLMEGILLSGTGGVIGLLLAAIALKITVPLLPESMPRIDGIHLDAGVVFFALVLALLTGALCGLAPAFAAIRTRVNENLKEGGRTGSAGGSHGRLRSALVVTEIAVALVLLTTAGALVRSFQKMRDVDPGFRADHVLVAGYNLPSQQYPNPTASDAFNRSLLDRLQAMPGIVAAGITNVLPASGFQGGGAYVLDETAHDDASGGQLKIAPWSASEGKYFQAMGIRLVQGRLFNADDKQGAPLVALVNLKLANRFWPKGDVIGRRLRVGTPESKTPWVTIVGVVENTKMNALDAPDTEQIYAPAQQMISMFGQFAPKDQGGFNGFIVLRSTLPPEQMTNALRSTVATLDPQLALQQMQTMDEALSSSEAPRRFNTSLVSVFAFGALLLATIGVYAVIAFSVSMRAQEMAIRMALGSHRGEIVRLVLTSGAKLAAIGCAAGLIGAIAISRLLGSILFNVSATDPLILTGSIATMIVLSLVACAIPAQRAASANPVDALRSE
jgi:predicted permease